MIKAKKHKKTKGILNHHYATKQTTNQGGIKCISMKAVVNLVLILLVTMHIAQVCVLKTSIKNAHSSLYKVAHTNNLTKSVQDETFLGMKFVLG